MNELNLIMPSKENNQPPGWLIRLLSWLKSQDWSNKILIFFLFCPIFLSVVNNYLNGLLGKRKKRRRRRREPPSPADDISSIIQSFQTKWNLNTINWHFRLLTLILLLKVSAINQPIYLKSINSIILPILKFYLPRVRDL